MRYAFIGLAVLVLAVLGFSNIGSLSHGPTELTRADQERLVGQRDLVFHEAQMRYGTEQLYGDERDLVVLQRLIDDRAFGPQQTYELQSLGVVFGDVFVTTAGYHWTIGTDDYGRDPTLRYETTPMQLNALTMISKRIEQGDEVDVQALYAKTLESLSSLEDPEAQSD